MSILSKLFGGRTDEAVKWESMPRDGSTFVEEQIAPYEHADRQVRVAFTPAQIAENACSWNVPTFYLIDSKACCFLKVESLSQQMASAIRDSISGNKTNLTATLHALPTYPIVALVLNVPTPQKMVTLEAVPDLANADVRDCLDSLLRGESGTFHFLLGNPPQLVASGQYKTASTNDLRRCLDKAAAHFKRIQPASLDYRLAGEEYLRTTQP